jgi:hypothetical protein
LISDGLWARLRRTTIAQSAEELPLTTPIVLFLVFGAFFGLATYSRRHLFSEGPTVRDTSASANTLRGRISWAFVCTPLWPIMVLTGLHSALLLARRRAVAARRPQD